MKQIFFYLLNRARVTAWQLTSLLPFAFYLLFTIPAAANPPETPTSTTSYEVTKTTNEQSVFPVGLNVGKRNVMPSILVRGKEDGTQAINFENWLLPYDAVIQGLKLNVNTLPDGQLEVRSPVS